MNKQFSGVTKAETNKGFDASFIASTPSIDRHMTIIPQENWDLKNFNANGPIFYQHYGWGDEMNLGGVANPDVVIGRGTAHVNSEGNLQVDIKFDDVSNNEIADKVKAKIEGGFLNAGSVGFHELTEGKWVDKNGNPTKGNGRNDIYEYGKVELLEFSIVNIPANAEALVMQKDYENRELRNQLKQTHDNITFTIDPSVFNLIYIDEEIEKLEKEKEEEELKIKIRSRKNNNYKRRINL